jgi:hypothetical protein
MFNFASKGDSRENETALSAGMMSVIPGMVSVIADASLSMRPEVKLLNSTAISQTVDPTALISPTSHPSHFMSPGRSRT